MNRDEATISPWRSGDDGLALGPRTRQERSPMTAPTTESRPEALAIPWGEQGRLALAMPDDWPAEVFWPDLGGAIDDYPAALGRALDAPEGCPRVEEQVGPGATVLTVMSRPRSSLANTRVIASTAPFEAEYAA